MSYFRGIYTLVIKGTVEQAKEALAKHGIESEYVLGCRYQSRTETSCTVMHPDITALNDWFNEVSDAAEPPFEPGTLLFFSRVR